MHIPSDLSECLMLNTVAATRAMLRRYDAQLKPFGATVQQFALLVAIEQHPCESVTHLAQRVYMDRTSLIRSLALLEKRQLVRRIATATGNMRYFELTEQGRHLLEQMIPVWQAAQSQLMAGISPEDAQTYLRVARYLAQ